MARSGSQRRVSAAAARAAAQRRRRNMLWLGSVAGTAVVIVIVVAALSFGRDIFAGPSTGAVSPTVDSTFPNFSLTLYQGAEQVGSEELDFAQLQGRPIVLNFWAGLCPPCRAEMPDFQRFYDESKGDVLLIGLDVGRFTGLGGRGDAEDLLEELNITYPAGFTSNRSVMRDYEVLSMPTTVFIDANGEVFENWSGALNREILKQITDAMLDASESPSS